VGGVDAGGQNVHVAALARALADLGAQVSVYTRKDAPDLPPIVELAPGVRVVHIDAGPATAVPKDGLFPLMPRFAAELGRSWEAWRPDVVHAHFWMSGWAALTAAEPLALPVAHTFHALGVVKRRHQGDADTSPPERMTVERLILTQADRILATCTDEVRELTELGAPRGRVTVVPCGVDLRQFWHEGPSEPRSSSSRHRLVVVGRLVPRKGVGDVVEALVHVPQAELIIAGGPSPADLADDIEARRLLSAARASGVADRVEFRGRVARQDLPALLRSTDLVVCAPWYEPFGIVPLEAMGCGVPVVASAVGGLLDTVVDGITGVHVPPRRPDLLAATIRDLLAQPDRRAAMGATASRRARLCSWRRVGAATLSVYEELVRGDALGEAAVR